MEGHLDDQCITLWLLQLEARVFDTFWKKDVTEDVDDVFAPFCYAKEVKVNDHASLSASMDGIGHQLVHALG